MERGRPAREGVPLIKYDFFDKLKGASLRPFELFCGNNIIVDRLSAVDEHYLDLVAQLGLDSLL